MAYNLENVRLLVVDDMQPMVTLLVSSLNALGFQKVHTATDGDDGFDKVCRHDPDLILTDWNMSPMNGLDFAKLVRQNSASPNPYVPIIMMTGFSARPRVERARDYGITEFLVKPFSASDLYNRIYQVIEKPRQFVEAEEFFGPDRRRKYREDYMGPKRRESDRIAKNSKKDSTMLKELTKKIKQTG